MSTNQVGPGRVRAALVAVLAVVGLGSSSSFAGAGTLAATGVSGAKYTFTVTCSTRSATARMFMQTATDFHGFTVSDNSGHTALSRYTVNGVPASSGPQDWVAAIHLDSLGASYRLDEVALDGTVTPVVAPVVTSDCPVYGGFGAKFVPIGSTRILDTRPASPIGYSGPKPGGSTSVELQVTGTAGIPANAVAVALNVTMTETTQPGFVQAFPTGLGTAGASSNINAEFAGQTIPNSVIVPIGIGGRVTLFTNSGTHLLADVSGYFVNATAPVKEGRFVTVAPQRVLDTRTDSPVNYTGPKPGQGATVRVNPVAAAGLPAGQVGAVAINVTATEASAAGFVQIAPAGGLVPGASSSLNVVRAGQTIPNMVIVAVSAAGEIDLFTQNGTNLIVDVLGWFTNTTAPASTSGLYFPVVPERVLDTRPDTTVNFDAERRPVLGETTKPAATSSVDVFFDGLPSGQVAAVVLNLTATESGAAGFVQGAAQLALSPGASSNLNVERARQTIANAAILPVSDARAISLYTQSSTNLIADLAGFFRK